MSDLHFWASTRYNFDSIKKLIRDNPHIGKTKVKRVIIHRRKPINTGLFFNIHQTHLVRKNTQKIHMIILDDLDFTLGCSETLTLKIFKNIIASAEIHKKVFIVCTDFASRIEFSNDDDAINRIGEFKHQMDKLADDQFEFFCYFDHEDHLDCSAYLDSSPLSEEDNKLAINIMVDDIEEVFEEEQFS
jgi:hypothetical protein